MDLSSSISLKDENIFFGVILMFHEMYVILNNDDISIG